MMWLMLVAPRFRLTKCLNMGCAKTIIRDGDLPNGVYERSRLVRTGENGRWIKLQNDFFLIPK